MCPATSCAQEAGSEQSFEPSLYLFGRVSNRDYRAAIAQTIRELKAEKGLTNERLAEKLGCSEGTIFNAENENGNLDPVTMLNLGAVFGGEKRLKRILALVNGCPEKPLTILDRIDRAQEDLAFARKSIVDRGVT